MPAAVEELFRYAGLARRIGRIAQAPLSLGGVQIGVGQKVKLELNSANRDPKQFVEPNRLNVTRRGVRHVALGAGPRACAGAPLIRMAAEVATSTFVQKFHSVAVREPVEWRGGAAFRAPARLLIHFCGLPK
jgi:cytochrome P450